MRKLMLVAVMVACSCVAEVDGGNPIGIGPLAGGPGTPFEACNLEVPAELSLAGDSIEGSIRHLGNKPCLLGGFEIEAIPSGALRLSELPEGLVLHPNEPARFTVLRTTQQQIQSGTVHVIPSTGAPSLIPVRDRVASAAECFSMTPGALDFGQTSLGCISATRSTTISNACDLPIRWSAGALSNEFQFETPIDEYEVLAAHSSQTLTLRFVPASSGAFVNDMLRINPGEGVWVATLLARSGEATGFEDTFVTGSAQTTFLLSRQLDQSAGVQVTIDGQPASGWQYDSAQNAIKFFTPPPADGHLIVRGDTGC